MHISIHCVQGIYHMIVCVCVCVCVYMTVHVCLIIVIAGLLLISECELPGQEYSRPSFKMFRECSNTNPAIRKVMSTEL